MGLAIFAEKRISAMMKEIYFAGGCFWGAEKFFRLIDGVLETQVGFANGNKDHPTYREVYTDTTGFAETVRVRFDPQVVSVRELTGLFLQMIDPFSVNRQGEDEGTRYRTGVYFTDPSDAPEIASAFSEVERAMDRPLAVERMPLRNYFPAEEEHQRYLDKNPSGYCHLSPGIFQLAKAFRPEKKYGPNQG